MALSVRTRFEVFKRDDFTCRYCGGKSPTVVLEVDHIVPKAEGGSDDLMNLATSCWACNSGKSCVPLSQVMTGEDPHDRAVLIMEAERQLREYNAVLEARGERILVQYEDLEAFWLDCAGWGNLSGQSATWLRRALETYPAERIRDAMRIAVNSRKTSSFAYVSGVLKNWKTEGKL